MTSLLPAEQALMLRNGYMRHKGCQSAGLQSAMPAGAVITVRWSVHTGLLSTVEKDMIKCDEWHAAVGDCGGSDFTRLHSDSSLSQQ